MKVEVPKYKLGDIIILEIQDNSGVFEQVQIVQARFNHDDDNLDHETKNQWFFCFTNLATGADLIGWYPESDIVMNLS